ncbi:arsenate reductase ArsC [Litorivivens sp.]|uniref:arsenate reductase ArsC n=1 Tax=Litorivivens sp. TaxID=2020868 RepID=UPI0035642B5F
MKILYICTHNRCRSILSEAITNHLAQGRIQAYSAGSQPAAEVHPLTLKYLTERGIPTAGLTSQSWDDFADLQPDIVVTVCDNAANEACPVWFGDTVKVHWGLPDPSKLTGSESEMRASFTAVMETIAKRVNRLLSLELEHRSPTELQSLLADIVEE